MSYTAANRHSRPIRGRDLTDQYGSVGVLRIGNEQKPDSFTGIFCGKQDFEYKKISKLYFSPFVHLIYAPYTRMCVIFL